MPSIRGMSISRVTTSGLTCSIFIMAKSPSRAVATTSISSSLSRSLGIIFRITAESSTTITLIFLLLYDMRLLDLPLNSLVFDRLAEQLAGVHDKRDAAITENRGPGKRFVLQPLAA